MSKLSKTIFAILLLTTFVSALHAAALKNVAICDDQDGWPPYLQYQLENGQRTGKLEGYTLDVVKLIFDKHGIKFDLTMLPWKRCLQSVEAGRHAMLLNAMLTPERSELYLTTKPFYSLTGVYVYLSGGPVPKITKPSDLGNYRVCGLYGYDYQPFGLGKDQVDQAAHSFEQVIKKMEYKRCELLIGHYEIMGQRSMIAGLSIFENPSFSFAKIPQLPPVPFVMLISRKKPEAQVLMDLLDDGLSKFLNSAEDKRLKSKWGIPAE